MTERVIVSLGSNLQAETRLPRAVELLDDVDPVRRASSVYQNPAVGAERQPDFLNAAVLIETGRTPEDLREILRGIEETLGRRRTEDRFAPRTVDLDIVLFGRRVAPRLRIPHPGLLEHPHVAVPAAELDPTAVHPVTAESLAGIAARLRRGARMSPRPDVTLRRRTREE